MNDLNIKAGHFVIVEEQENGYDLFTFVTPNGQEIGSFSNMAHVDYPEDLTWERDISEIFDCGFRIGWAACAKEISEKAEKIMDLI